MSNGLSPGARSCRREHDSDRFWSLGRSVRCSFGMMSRRIEVQLTSTNPEGVWTWRAAGAKEPKGSVGADLLYEGAKVGDVVRAEADFDIDGIRILQVFPPKAPRASSGPQMLELKGTGGPLEGVTTSLVGKRGKSSRPGRPPQRDGRDERIGAGRRPPRREGGPSPDSRRGTDVDRVSAGAGRERGGARERPRPDGSAGAAPASHRSQVPKRLSVRNTHRAAALASLPEEQRPIAEQVLKGGIPAVRQALEVQNAQARSTGAPEVPSEPVLVLAEKLLPRLKAAAWRDRAEAVAASVDQVGLRDLRSAVAGADAARDDDARALAATLRSALEKRIEDGRQKWLADIGKLLQDGRVVRALRLSSHPSDPAARFPAELALDLSRAASAAMTPDTLPDRWLAVLEAVAASPVRRSVHPSGLPPEPGEALLSAAKRLSGKVPAMAQLLGIEMPPPPGPPRGPGAARPMPPKPYSRHNRATSPRSPGSPGDRPSGEAPSGEAGVDARTGRAVSDGDRTEAAAQPVSAAPAAEPVAAQPGTLTAEPEPPAAEVAPSTEPAENSVATEEGAQPVDER